MDKLVEGLPFPESPSKRGEQLLQVLLERVTASLESPSSMPHELEFAQKLVLERRMAGPLELLRYYSSHLTKRLFLQKLTQPDQEWLLGKLAAVLSFIQRGASDQETLQCQWSIVAACPYLFEVWSFTCNLHLGANSLQLLIPTMMGSSALTCATLLRTCLLVGVVSLSV